MSFLTKYGEYASNSPYIVLAIVVAITIVMATAALDLEIETDFDKSLPEDLPSIKTQRLLEDKFDEADSFFILVKINEEVAYDNQILDIRNVEVMNKLYELEETIKKRSEVLNVIGPHDIVIAAYGYIPDSQEFIDILFEDSSLVSDDYTLTYLLISTKMSGGDENILGFTAGLEEDIKSIGFPGSIKTGVTGGPLIETTIFSLLESDLIRTLSIALLFILIVLVAAYRSPIKGSFALLLLIISVIWTGGTMKLLNIPLSIITVMVGALIIGIGIDYVIHVINRYDEETAKKMKRDKATGIAIGRVGIAIIGTSVTTIVSFMSQTAAGVPLLTHMGIALSLGIFYSMVAALFILPAIFPLEEKICVGCRKITYGGKK
ncbi:MMPL family transporter [Candidatus Aenigmatarchaeota archaeon]